MCSAARTGLQAAPTTSSQQASAPTQPRAGPAWGCSGSTAGLARDDHQDSVNTEAFSPAFEVASRHVDYISALQPLLRDRS